MSDDGLNTEGEGERKAGVEVEVVVRPGGEEEEDAHRREVRRAGEVPPEEVLETHQGDDEREPEELDGLQIPQAPAPAGGGDGQRHGALVHQGQPEM